MLQAVERHFAPARPSTYRWPRWAFASLIAVIMLVSLIGGSVMAASALPGDWLYPLKLGTEELRLFLTRDPAQRAELEAQFQQERLREVGAILTEHREVPVHFRGPLEEWGTAEWSVAGYVLTLVEDTLIEGRPQSGSEVEVWATATPDSGLVARHLIVLSNAATRMPTNSPFPTPSRPAHAATPRSEPVIPSTSTPHLTRTPTQRPPTATPTPTATPSLSPTPAPTTTPTSHPAKPTPSPCSTPSEWHNPTPTPLPFTQPTTQPSLPPTPWPPPHPPSPTPPGEHGGEPYPSPSATPTFPAPCP